MAGKPAPGLPGNVGEEAARMDRLAPCDAHIHLRLPVEPESVAAAHHSILGIASNLEPSVFDDLRLLISELVTNSISHGRLTDQDRIELQVDIDKATVHVEVRDPGPGFDPASVPRSQPPEEGWGLLFLREIASRWGVERGDRTRVWFELDLPPAGPTDRFAQRGRG
jgi:anti-sigma regulatory factor (Ser/Thr protein kinase)